MPEWFLNKQGALRTGWKAVGFFLLLDTLGYLAALGRQGFGWFALRGPWLGVSLGVLASLLCLRMEGRPFASLGLRREQRWVLECAGGLLGGILVILVTALLVRGMGGVHWERTSNLEVRQIFFSAWPLLGIAIHEELLFRGYPFQRVIEGLGPWAGQLLFALLFALVHWRNPGMQGGTRAWATLNIGLAALLFGLGYLRTQSLALPIGAHLGWNWAQGSLLGFAVSGTTDYKGLWTPVFNGLPEWLTGGAFGLEASLPCTLVCSASILALWRWKGSTSRGPSAGASTASGS
jgi:membrane protease YdiL (CAAX protease family)